ncbi:ATP-binding cassette domain-containing protein [Collinsella sp. An268]|uniref:ABC transporter ATP-binding protein n=1 Tax=Collinsella sp. An268 TaxID=1965612 RepID=UPI000B38974E|nr:ATP-binding cassette domain-containing protein [Collinsella sp. An268]OUO63519.1 ABC transporter ATP-binding protein [Collinsella sp. An268]
MSLAVENVSFAYPGRAPVLRDVSLAVESGERVALTAPSGTGKTTLCRVIAGYLAPAAGRIVVDGVEAGGRARAGLCRRARAPRSVQLIWQHPEQAFDPRLTLAASLAEGVAGGRRLSRGEALSLIESSELVERFEVRPAWLDRLPHELSGGELMRLAIVRALLAEPRYLICDEMTASLDALTQAQIWRETLTLADERGMGLIVVSHSPALLARVSTRAVSLA